MDAERARTFLLHLPHVVETAQFGGIVFWVGDKAVGGKMFVMMNPDARHQELPISYAAGRERYADLLEIEGLRPAPYLARAFWVGVERWDAFRTPEWEFELSAAHALVLSKLPAKVQASLELPQTQLKRLIAERRRMIAAKAAGDLKSKR